MAWVRRNKTPPVLQWSAITALCAGFIYILHGTSLNTKSIHCTKFGAHVLPSPAVLEEDSNVSVSSPDGRLVFQCKLASDSVGGLFYSISGSKGPVILQSRFSILASGASSKLQFTTLSRSSASSEWAQSFGERAIVPDRYNEVAIGLSRIERFQNTSEMVLRVRAYDEGVAFQFELTQEAPQMHWQDGIADEVEFNVPFGTHAYWNTYLQGTYERRLLQNLEGVAKPCEPPLTLELADGRWASIMEAAQVDFAHMTIGLASENRNISKLDGTASITHVPYQLPWRVVIVADTPGQLLERNYILLNLSPPNQLEDTSWIKPGRVIMSVKLETDFVMSVIDFAADFNIDYVELDTGWYGDEYDPRSDATTWNKTLIDLPKVISYAKSKQRKFMLYVNHIELERHLDEVLDTLQSWGVDGVKYGFVNVGPQNWTQWLHHAIVEAAKRKLVVDVHDNYRSTGFHRTYPNMLQVEGIYGDEQFPTAYQSTIFPFTRFLTGPADHTYSFHYFKMVKTKAHQLALSIINFGPLQFLFWYDWPGSYAGGKLAEIELWRDLPTVWDDTRVLNGRPGQLVTVARRQGDDWWVGSITNETAQTSTFDLKFLEPGRAYEAVIYEDGPANQVVNRIANVDCHTNLSFDLHSSGGAAMRIRARPI